MNNKIKKLIILITVLSMSIGSVFWATRELWSNTILDGITVWIDWNTSIANVSGNDGISILSSIFQWFKWELFSIVMVIALGAFIFIGIRLASARWNPEEFKKAMLHFVYSIVWIFFIFIAWWLVKLVSSLSL